MNSIRYHAFIVPSQDVKSVKNGLEGRQLLNKKIKIQPHGEESHRKSFLIPTSLETHDARVGKGHSIDLIDQGAYFRSLQSCYESTSIETTGIIPRSHMQNAFRSAVQQSLCKISETHLDSIETAAEKLLATLPAAYSIYHPLLLIPSTILERAAWNRLLLGYVIPDQSNNLAHFDLGPFFVQVAEATSTTHVAINSPIPTHNEPHAPDTDSSQVPFNAAADITSTNILRSPTNLIPLHGDFGPPLPSFPNHIPSENDFEKAFWVSTTQNGIKQTWAPRYTMFSKGNVTEKARLLTLPSVQNLQHKPWTALDLFSGIGYFAFSYARAGAARVLCWDLNPWSTEGLRRGAVRNGWEVSVVASPQHAIQSNETVLSTIDMRNYSSHVKFLVFCESNALAMQRIDSLRKDCPPIRHVNCGMLPDAGLAWRTAVKCLDWELGGWTHLHETVREDRLEARTEEIRKQAESLIRELEQAKGESRIKAVRIDHIERVKSVGPRMLHVVVDLWVSEPGDHSVS